jgi:hypothetical protein
MSRAASDVQATIFVVLPARGHRLLLLHSECFNYPDTLCFPVEQKRGLAEVHQPLLGADMLCINFSYRITPEN